MLTKNKIFYAEAAKGYIIKVIVDTLCGGGISRGIFVIEKSGMILRQSDQGSTILYDVDLPCAHLRNYKCAKPMVISVNLKHMQGLLKTIKKKDCLTMHIDSKQLGKLYITIRPEGAREVNRFETKGIAYQLEEDYILTPLPDGGYEFPMVINASDFQKIKQLTTISKKITITIQKSNYLSFKCDAGIVMDAELGFGQFQEFDDDPSEPDQGKHDVPKNGKTNGVGASASANANSSANECLSCGNEKTDCWCECEECGEYKNSECECGNIFDGSTITEDVPLAERTSSSRLNASEDDSPEDGSRSSPSEANEDGLDGDLIPFAAEYHSSILNKLIKLPGLCAQMQFYAPHIAGYPLRIEVNAGQGGYTLGKIQVYIKDVNQINYEASLQDENDNVVQVTKTKGKGKKKN